MAEPSTPLAASTAGAITLTAMLPGIEPNTLIGACAGATLFVMSARDLCLFTRLVYLLISVSMGYLGGPPVLGHIVDEPAVSAFLFSAGVVTLGLRVIHSVDEIDISRWFRPKG